ncbi:MAG TPA: MGMT family protein [Blastocatellia bacterium]|nr:MGMT family protein [Blastocatellia bacterium]
MRNQESTKTKDKGPKPTPAKFERVFEKVYRIVLRIPRGRVMTYGQIARLLEERYSPRLIGWAMHATPDDGRAIPWHRVINSRGGISTGRLLLNEPQLQQLLLEAEGVVFDERGRCDLKVHQWSPREKQIKAKLDEVRPSKPKGREKTLQARQTDRSKSETGRKKINT